MPISQLTEMPISLTIVCSPVTKPCLETAVKNCGLGQKFCPLQRFSGQTRLGCSADVGCQWPARMDSISAIGWLVSVLSTSPMIFSVTS